MNTTGGTAVKLCGLRSLDDARAAVATGADLLGFVLARSPRQLGADDIAEIVARLEPGVWATVAVVVDTSDGTVAAVRRSGVDMVQLARGASAETCADLSAACGVPVIGVLHVAGEAIDHSHLSAMAAVSELVLLDAASPAGGGSGRAFAPSVLETLGPEVVATLGVAGGLRPDTVAALVRDHAPRLVDVSSGIERDGEKDPVLMEQFVTAVRAAAAPDTGARIR